MDTKTNLFLLTNEELLCYYEELLFDVDNHHDIEFKIDDAHDEIIKRMNSGAPH